MRVGATRGAAPGQGATVVAKIGRRARSPTAISAFPGGQVDFNGETSRTNGARAARPAKVIPSITAKPDTTKLTPPERSEMQGRLKSSQRLRPRRFSNRGRFNDAALRCLRLEKAGTCVNADGSSVRRSNCDKRCRARTLADEQKVNRRSPCFQEKAGGQRRVMPGLGGWGRRGCAILGREPDCDRCLDRVCPGCAARRIARGDGIRAAGYQNVGGVQALMITQSFSPILRNRCGRRLSKR